jgi:hypothetical protein
MLPSRFFGSVEGSGIDSLPDESLLVAGEFNFHASNVGFRQ